MQVYAHFVVVTAHHLLWSEKLVTVQAECVDCSSQEEFGRGQIFNSIDDWSHISARLDVCLSISWVVLVHDPTEYLRLTPSSTIYRSCCPRETHHGGHLMISFQIKAFNSSLLS